MQTNEALQFVQRQIGKYEFKNIDLLEQAFTRRSYTEENGGENNEILEFIGDKILDFIVVKILSEKFGEFEVELPDKFSFSKKVYSGQYKSEFDEGQLSEIKARLVNRDMLSKRIDRLGISGVDGYDSFYGLLKMSNSDIANGVANQPSVKEDVFEAIVGAVALDCAWDLKVIQGVVETMLDVDSNIDTEPLNYVQYIQKWVADTCNSVPVYDYLNARYSTTVHAKFDGISQSFSLDDPRQNEVEWWCMMHISDGLCDFRGFGKNQSEARKNACKEAYKYLNNQKLLPTIRDEIENPNRDEAISQLEISARRGYFPIPTYEFSQTYDMDGNPIWKAECHITNRAEFRDAEASKKKDAKKDAAYKMLLHMLEVDND